jgi:hypothetical protein
MTGVAAWTYAAATGLVVAFQVAVALGAPWGELAMGGRFPGRMPPALRAAAVAQGVVLSGLGWIVLDRAKALGGAAVAPGWAIWTAVGVGGLSLALNLATPSRWERAVWAPVALLMTVSSLVVALGS